MTSTIDTETALGIHVNGSLADRDLALVADARAIYDCRTHVAKAAWLSGKCIVMPSTDYWVIEAAFTGHAMAVLGELVRVLDRMRDDA